MAVDAWLGDLAVRLGGVNGVVGVTLGGSRARGEHSPGSDYDLGLYYRPPLDTGALLALARAVSGPAAEVTEPGAWGPWVDGGAWLRIEGAPVDWIYRDLDRVQAAWDDAQRGQFRFNAQTGHPLGVPDFAYAGEVALGIVLHDPTGHLTDLQEATRSYPAALADAVVERLWEADFLLAGLRKSVQREDCAWVAGCLFRVVLLCAHALHGRAGRWLVNEKGAVTSAGRLPISPPQFSDRARHLLGHVGTTMAELVNTLDQADELVSDTRAACRAAP
jgi:predicted nucleotidyltransferase